MIVPMEIVADDVDWLTATCEKSKLNPDQSLDRFTFRAEALLRKEERRGCDVNPWSWMSFTGWRAGQITWGYVHDRAIVRLSGLLAASQWSFFCPDATNVSRIDVALTCRILGAWRDLSYMHMLEARQHASRHCPQFKVRRIDGGKHGNSLYLGSRSSQAYGRIYDKHAETGLDHYADCWRYEVEFKGDAARFVALSSDDDYLERWGMASHGLRWLRSHGITCDVQGAIRTPTGGVNPPSSDSSRLAWLAGQVKPTVQRLIERGKLPETLQAIGVSLDCLPNRNCGDAFNGSTEEVH